MCLRYTIQPFVDPRKPCSSTSLYLLLLTLSFSRYGLGTVLLRQEKLDLSIYHLRRAIAINQCSSVLYCYLGMALHAANLIDEAIRCFTKVCLVSYKNINRLISRSLGIARCIYRIHV